MAKRNSLTEKEVSIIKSLLKQGKFQNKQIIGMINRSRGDAFSDISSGRISNIKNNQIQKYIPIEPASAEDTDDFLLHYEHLGPIAEDDDPSPVSDKRINLLFPLARGAKTHFEITETDIIECKKSHQTPMKTIAAFANNGGGYFALGVENETWKILGIPDKKIQKFDFNKLNQSIRSALGMEIKLQRKVVTYGDKKIVGDYPLKVCIDSGGRLMAYYRACGKKTYLVFYLSGKKRFLLSSYGLLLNYLGTELQDGQTSKLIKLWRII